MYWRHGRWTTNHHISYMVIGTELRAKIVTMDTGNIQREIYMAPNICSNRCI